MLAGDQFHHKKPVSEPAKSIIQIGGHLVESLLSPCLRKTLHDTLATLHLCCLIAEGRGEALGFGVDHFGEFGTGER